MGELVSLTAPRSQQSLQQSHLRYKIPVFLYQVVLDPEGPKSEHGVDPRLASTTPTAPLAYSAGGDMSRSMLQCLFSKSGACCDRIRAWKAVFSLFLPQSEYSVDDRREGRKPRGTVLPVMRSATSGAQHIVLNVTRQARQARIRRTVSAAHDRHLHAIYIRLQRAAFNITINAAPNIPERLRAELRRVWIRITAFDIPVRDTWFVAVP